MIIGTGCDIIGIARVERLVARFGRRFLDRVLTPAEHEGVAFCGGSVQSVSRYCAKRFAAKEATMKAIGTGLSGGVCWRDVDIVRLGRGKPGVRLSGVSAEKLRALLPDGQEPVIHLSLSDDVSPPGWAQAFVVIEARPGGCVRDSAR